MSNTSFGKWLKNQRRRKNNISQTELGNILGVSPGHISRLEAGGRGTSMDLLIKIADFFRVDLEEVVLMSEGFPLPQKSTSTIAEEKFNKLKREESKQQVLKYIDFIAEQEENEFNAGTSKKKTPKSETT